MIKAATTNTKIINASAEKLYHAVTNPEALAVWQAPGDMTAKVHNFNLKVGGGYEMSLYYPETQKEAIGKTSAKEDRFTARFTELIPFTKIVQAINFNATDPAFSGEMIMEILLEPLGNQTKVTFNFKDIPVGIKPEDNEKGTELSLQKLAEYVK